MCSLVLLVFSFFFKGLSQERGCTFFICVSFQFHPAQTSLTEIMPRLFLLGDICPPFLRLCNTNLKCCLQSWKRRKPVFFLDPFGVRARDPVRTHNWDPRQQSGFSHRITVVKPPLTAWFSISPVKCNVPCNLAVNHYPACLETILFFKLAPSSLFLLFFCCVLDVPLFPCFSILLSPCWCWKALVRLPLWCCGEYFWLDTAYMQNANCGEIRCSTI